jgi:hypothetical protein
MKHLDFDLFFAREWGITYLISVRLQKEQPAHLRASSALGFPGKTSAEVAPDHRKSSGASFQ